MPQTFLKAEWRKLIMANYEIAPALLQDYLPPRTELDLWQGKCFVSLVGFVFDKVKLLGVRVPLHTQFEEVNLRFYVKHLHRDGHWKRGVVFISEIVPRPAIAFVANLFYGERYQALSMRHVWKQEADKLSVAYSWKKGAWNQLSVETDVNAIPITAGSEEEFITEHYWGYTKLRGGRTGEYEVVHPKWDVYPVKQYIVDADFGKLYGERFSHLSTATPSSIFLAEGSEVTVRSGTRIELP